MRTLTGYFVIFGMVAIAGITILTHAQAGQLKTDIYHLEGNGSYNPITIADPAYDSHIAHGDKDVETFYIDADGDGFGSTSLTGEARTAQAGFVDIIGDFDDTDAAVNQGVLETAGNGIYLDYIPDTPDEFMGQYLDRWAAG